MREDLTSYNLVQVAATIPRAAGLVSLGRRMIRQPPAPSRRPSLDVGRGARQPHPGNRAWEHVAVVGLARAGDGTDAITAVDLETDGQGDFPAGARPAAAVIDVQLGLDRERHVQTVTGRGRRRVDGHGDLLGNRTAGTRAVCLVGGGRGRTDHGRSTRDILPRCATDVAVVGAGARPAQRAGLADRDRRGVSREGHGRNRRRRVDDHRSVRLDITARTVASHGVGGRRGRTHLHRPVQAQRLRRPATGAAVRVGADPAQRTATADHDGRGRCMHTEGWGRRRRTRVRRRRIDVVRQPGVDVVVVGGQRITRTDASDHHHDDEGGGERNELLGRVLDHLRHGSLLVIVWGSWPGNSLPTPKLSEQAVTVWELYGIFIPLSPFHF